MGTQEAMTIATNVIVIKVRYARLFKIKLLS
jgi:hypothetical protein